MSSIAIIGAGFVGSALQRFFESQGVTPALYDPAQGYRDVSVLAAAQDIFIAVPTPFYMDGRGFDDTFLREAIEVIPEPGKTIILKSTVQPGTTDRLQALYPQHRILCNPEFLTESQADSDMQHPNRQMVGYTDASRPDAERVMAMLPRAPFERIVPAAVAETVKCVGNSFYAVKVSFANQVYDLCTALGVPYDQVKECIVQEPWMGEMHWNTPHKGYRGYGGKCLPKDTRMTIQAGDLQGLDLSLLKEAERYNNALAASQGLDVKWEEGSPRRGE
ncbi:MAG: hypothetical protein RL141_928 [Candidatus Parcubacteria bacterium]|jgi:UDPglucose 6-dehydrogenase